MRDTTPSAERSEASWPIRGSEREKKKEEEVEVVERSKSIEAI